MWTLGKDPAFQLPDERRDRIPTHALALSLAPLAVPAAAARFAPDWLHGDQGLILWICPLLPAFLLAYYRGWRGAALALAAAMASLVAAHVVFTATHVPPPPWPWMLGVVLVYLLLAQGIGLLAELLRRERRAAREEARSDPLTALPNRRAAEEHLDHAFAAAIRGRSLALILFDIDHFKRFNDLYGHAAGDRVLHEFARVLSSETRRMDLSARFGGEEFISILSPCGVDAAAAFAERVRARVSSMDAGWGPVTVSAGVAAFREGMGAPDLLIASADHALYRAKEAGRNRVVVFGRNEGGEALPPFARPWSGEGPAPPEAVGAPGGDRWAPPLIVVVDDDESVELSIARALVRMGYNVVDARSPAHVLDLFDEFGPRISLLITDVIMPEMNGLTLVSALAERGHRVRVLYISGYMHGEVHLPGIPGMVSGFLSKPVELDALRSAVDSLLATEAGEPGTAQGTTQFAADSTAS